VPVRRENNRQRQARLRREAKQAERAEKERLKRAKNEKKRDLKIAIENFNRVNNVNVKFVSRVKSYYKRRGLNYTTEQVEDILLSQYMPIPDEEWEEEEDIVNDAGLIEEPIKIGENHFQRARVQCYFIRLFPVLVFNDENLPEIFRLMDILYGRVPEGFYMCFALKGFYVDINAQREGWAGVPRLETVCKTTLSDNIDGIFQEVQTNGRLNVHSSVYYNITEIQVLYEVDQGGRNIVIDEELKSMYKIFNPVSNNNCGKKCLEQYNILGRSGFMSITDIKAYNPPVPVFENLEEAGDSQEFILLYKNHFIICKSKELVQKEKEEFKKTEEFKNKKDRQLRKNKNKLNEKIKYMKTDKYKQEIVNQAVESIKNYKVLIFDIETEKKEVKVEDSEKVRLYHTPLLIGFAHKCEEKYIYNYYYGENSTKEFIKMLRRKNYTHLVGYNSGSFDYILLKKEIMSQGGNLIEYRNGANKVMRGRIIIDGKTIEIIDLMNFTTGKLSDNLEAYKCEISKGTIDYDKIGKDHSKEFKKDLIDYCRLDVIGTYQLYEKLELPYTERGIVFLDLFTSSQGAMKILKYYWKINKYDLPEMMSKEKSDFYRRGNNGGRTEVFKREFKSDQYDKIKSGEIKYEDVNHFMESPDINSLYPWAMWNFKYPVGKPKFTLKEKKDKIAYYECKVIKPKDIKFPVCNDKVHNSYNLFDVSDVVYNNVDIEQMRKYGYKVIIKFGYYWEESDYIFRDYIEEFYNVKKNSAKGSPQYGNAKLMLNSIYGKTLQRTKNELYFTITDKEEILKAKMENKNGTWTMEADIENNLLLYAFKGDIGDFVREMPHLGGLVLSYSKLRMYEMITKTDPFYTDTDSLYIDNKYHNLVDWGKELGQFSNDYDGKIIYGAFTAKKVKYIELLLPSGEIEKHYTGKGCNKDGLSKHDFKNMLKTLPIENVRPFKFVRNLNDGTVEHIINDTKIIKMNDGNRYFKNNNDSYPLGHNETPKERIEEQKPEIRLDKLFI
jgi:hypothetical protein